MKVNRERSHRPISKINQLLEAARWRFFAAGSAPANIRLEPSVTIKSAKDQVTSYLCLRLQILLQVDLERRLSRYYVRLDAITGQSIVTMLIGWSALRMGR